jgi:glyoxylase-like metal-dependent hydrolase (beta-lactamase superfamily II)
MIPSDAVREVLPGVFRWEAFSPDHRVELTSHEVRDGLRGILFDPIPLPDGAIASYRVPDAMVLTNENHDRDAKAWRTRWNLEVWAAPEAGLTLPEVRRWNSAIPPFSGWELIPLPGAPGGETAFHLPARSLVVFGDAVVNLPGRSLEILPDKYCRDPARLRESLRRLPAFEHALFAHGEPLLGGADVRIAALL